MAGSNWVAKLFAASEAGPYAGADKLTIPGL